MSDLPTGSGPETGSGRARWPLWLKLLLGGSLAINLLVAGLGLGIWWRLSDFPRHELAGPRGASAFVFAFDKEQKRAFWKDMRATRGSARSARPDPSALLEMLRADPPDLDGLAAAVSTEAKRGQARQAQMQSAWLARIAEMSAEDRNRYADRLERMWQQRGKRKPGP